MSCAPELHRIWAKLRSLPTGDGTESAPLSCLSPGWLPPGWLSLGWLSPGWRDPEPASPPDVPGPVNRIARIFGALAMATYPILVWRGLESGSPRRIALLLLFVLAPVAWFRLRALRARGEATDGDSPEDGLRGLAVIPFVSITVLGLASALDSLGMILIVPVAVNLVFLAVFGWTLRAGSRPIVERFARLELRAPSPEQIAWCRLWTQLWCGFFVLNGSIAALTAALAPVSVWAFYNGMLAYLLIGALFATEWLLRRRRFPPVDDVPSTEA